MNTTQTKENKYPACLSGEQLEQLNFPIEFLEANKGDEKLEVVPSNLEEIRGKIESLRD